MTPDPILERLDVIMEHLDCCDRESTRRVLRELLADVAIECADACIGGDLLTMDYKAAIRARFGVAPKEAALDDQRCAVCGWTLTVSRAVGCVRGNCSMRPRPARLYDPVRAEMEEMSNQPKDGT